MKILLDGWTVLAKDGNIILEMVFLLLLAAGIVFFSFKIFAAQDLNFPEYFSLSMAGAFFPLLLGIGPFMLLGVFFNLQVEFLFVPLLVLVCGLMFVAGRNKGRPLQPSVPGMALILILAALVYIRLAFISALLVPPYFDSAAHYSLIDRLIASYQSAKAPDFVSLTGGYYHVGFHILMAAISLVLRADLKDAMLVFGQVVVALIPLPLFFIVKRQTGSDASGLFAVVLAGLGWPMPADAMNWGKYPALTGLLAFEFAAALACFLFRSSPFNRPKWLPVVICGFCVCTAAFIHSRMLVLAGIALLGVLATLGWQRLSTALRNLVFLLTVTGLVVLLLIVRSKPVLNLALDPYLKDGFWVSLAVLILSILAFFKFPRAVFFGIFSLGLLLGCLFVPVIGLLPGRAYQTLLDRPFVEIILFLPLSLLAGLGLAAMLNMFAETRLPRRMPGLVVGIFCALVFTHALARYDFYPSACCRIFSTADAVAFDWMDKNLPADAYILIASSDLVLFESGATGAPASVDAGIWITPLIGRKTSSMSYRFNLSRKNVLSLLRLRGIQYVYIGGSARHFRAAWLKSNPASYRRIFFLPGARVYQLLDAP